MSDSDTICALATPPGKAGIAIIRISGSQAKSITTHICPGIRLQPRQAYYRGFYDPSGVLIDRGMVIYFPAPGSFTGEDVVELQPHANPHLIRQLLDTLCALGARPARAGEFSERAFINGKQDLSQLEATADLIAANSLTAAHNALLSMSGEFARYINRIVESITRIRAYLEATLDFPEEEMEERSNRWAIQQLAEPLSEIDSAIHYAQIAKRIQNGFRVALAGKPNVGKSSLLNALAGSEQAIVTDIPGTTRDTVHVSLELNGIECILIDTAGIRSSTDQVEKAGIERTHAAAAAADIVIWVRDQLELPGDIPLSSNTVIHLVNKIDLLGLPAGLHDDTFYLSALSGSGVAEFRRFLSGYVTESLDASERPVTARQRHLDCLMRAREALSRAMDNAKHGQGLELVAEELRQAQQALDEITGRFSTEDLLGRIFSEFCIGK